MPYKNKIDQAASARRHYLKNKERIKARARSFTVEVRKRNRKYINKYKSAHPCVDCGFSDIRALDFDHVNGEKDLNLAQTHSYWSVKRIQREIDKCEVRCSNCHRIKTWERLRMSEKSNGETEAS